MENNKTKTAGKGMRLVTSLVLVLALLTSLFAFTVGMADEDDNNAAAQTSTTSTTKDPKAYTVYFDANGGYFDEKDENGKNKTVIERDGYTGQGLYNKTQITPHYATDAYGQEAKVFEGWTATNDSKVNVDPATYDPEKTITVKAVWGDRITVTFDDQKGNKTNYYFNKGDTLAVKEIPQPSPSNGKVFAGWYEDAACTKEALTYGVLKPTESLTYYAKYEDGATITLNANGGHYIIAKGENTNGSINEELTTVKTVYYTKGTTLQDESPDENYPNKFFAGYYTTSDFQEGTKVNVGDVITSDMTLYAKWTDTQEMDPVYYIEYKVYNDTAKEWRTVDKESVIQGNVLTKAQTYDAPYKDGLEFIGWYTDMNLTNEAPAFNGTYKPTDDITLYAKYNDVVSINISYWYANNNGTNVYLDKAEATYVKNVTGARADIDSWYYTREISDNQLKTLDIGNIPGIKIDPTEYGISTTWYADKAHTKVVNGKADLDIDKNGNTNIYGVLVKRQAVTLKTAASIGGEIQKDFSKISKDPAKDDKYITATVYLNNDLALNDAVKPYRVNEIEAKQKKAFVGWTEKEGSTTLVDTKKVKGVEELYAVLGNAYIVTFDFNGGYDRAANDTASARKNKVTYTVAADNEIGKFVDTLKPYPYNDVKYFAGWATDAEGKNIVDAEKYVVTDDVTLYAVWKNYEDTVDNYTGIRKQIYNGEEAWWRVVDGKVVPDATGIYQNENGWWRVENGKVNFEANGIYKNEYGWWKTTAGKVTFNETGIFKNEYGWWRVVNSKVDFTANGIYKNDYGWWKTTNGKVTFKENGIFKNEYGWWKVENSKVNFKFTGIASNEYGTWYVNKGKVDFTKNGKVTYNGVTYNVTKGKAVKA